ncbi:hypothetical protein HY633_04880 [Candidatus Uhrbacteria bacterium]|nr:hypothetical protein [Candidatus Uhrbacteria bacterium]
MRDSCRHMTEDIRKILYRDVKTLSKDQLDYVMAAVRELKLKSGGPLYRKSFSVRLKELRHEYQLTEPEADAILEALFSE